MKRIKVFLLGVLIVLTFTCASLATVAMATAPAPISGRMFIDNITVYYGYYDYVVPKFSGDIFPVTYSYDTAMLDIDEYGKITPLTDSGRTTVTAKTECHTVKFEVNIDTLETEYNVPTHYLAIEQFASEWDNFTCNERETVIFAGDSFMDRRYFITDFYTRFAGKNAFVSGVSGSYAAQWYYFGQKYLSTDIKAIVLHVGTNDLFDLNCSAEEVIESLIEMFNFYHYVNSDIEIYWWTIENRIYHKPRAKQDEVKAVNAAITAFAEDKQWLTVMDSYSEFTLSTGVPDGSLYGDTVHPNSAGYDVLFNLVTEAGLTISLKH